MPKYKVHGTQEITIVLEVEAANEEEAIAEAITELPQLNHYSFCGDTLFGVDTDVEAELTIENDIEWVHAETIDK